MQIFPYILYIFFPNLSIIKHTKTTRKDEKMKRLTKRGEIPYSLGLTLETNEHAKTRFGTLSSEQKGRIISYINDAHSPHEKQKRAGEMVERLSDNESMWFYD